VTWPAPLSLAGATAGPCSPPSGSHFPIGVTTVTCRVDDDHGTFGFARFTVDVQIAAPSVVTQPSPVTVPAGTTATFSAAASGLPQPDVKWESSRDGGASFTAIPGATSPTYSFVAQVFDDGALFRAVFSNPYGTVSTDSARLTVTPVTPVVVAGVGTATEPDGGTTTLVSVPVKLSVASKDPVSVQWQTLDAGAPRNDGFATTPDDFTMAGGTLTFAPGETQASIAVPIVGDQVQEPNELIVVAFTAPQQATLGGVWGLGFGVITNDD
jgi:hypothetical protein